MKNILIGIAIAAATLAACNNSSNNTTDTKQADAKNDTAMAGHQQTTTDTVASQTASASNTAAFPAKEIIAGYLQLKNALAKDNGKDAATAGNVLVSTLAKVDMKSLSEAQMKSYMDIADDLKEHAEHIGTNAGKIDHQREHFELLSKDIADLIKTFGNGGQTLYKDFCPMANDGKGAIWISEVKEIKNPYLGSKMPDCGTIKETIK
ncbi:MAG: DUF3347 domain-containing protein [Hydrotalea flava]|jgi:hypothetical protein|uniref:DUF3347 domain-containing protein n=1 Tax=Hydrotalea lipotrueae TaxID=2803817 RepID=UPI001698DD8F|nr:DUF3347 domain-containing protein [Hydrotalea lipotrueae]NIM35589.1 DUF3347 domain-containing protein [Hydrotalea flava]NIM38446.1 DUF3347 domain-containing protein [Hydrotalea flava]NIN03616.1 DUF3347 domain-containing protein [Hydrotalea flava]NIN15303.1 DUF3347 domain-containing protein [Hydrotalea flava]NIO94372.1 DUF3347 domain-containing protein [Hydrotalea flava]